MTLNAQIARSTVTIRMDNFILDSKWEKYGIEMSREMQIGQQDGGVWG